MGPLESLSLRQVNVNSSGNGTTADVTYAATFAKGNGQIVAKLKGDGQAWRFEGFRVDSPTLTQALAKTAAEAAPMAEAEEQPAEAVAD